MNQSEQSKPLLFGLGTLYVTAGIQELMDQGLDMTPFIQRHATGDWGDVCEDDAAENYLSVKKGFRILSAYTCSLTENPETRVKVWIITEADRSATTILLPEEY